MSTTERMPLTRARIIAAAVELVDQNGLEALSMRKLGAALGVEAMSLYNHVDNKDDVLDGILNAVMETVTRPDPDQPWPVQLRELSHEFRRVGLDHPGVLPMFSSRRMTPDGFAAIAAIHEIVLAAGFSAERSVDAFVYVSSFLLGYSQIDLGRVNIQQAGRQTDYRSWTDPRYARSVELGLQLVARDWTSEFDRCIDLMIEGLMALLQVARIDHA